MYWHWFCNSSLEKAGVCRFEASISRQDSRTVLDATVALAAYGFAILVGVVAAGLIGSAWTIAAGDEPELAMLFQYQFDWLIPLRVAVFTFSLPRILFERGIAAYIEAPIASMVLFALALGWSFLQGVFILTQIFNLP
jgi:hypothetical protein